MKIKDIIASGKIMVSCELFPPKKVQDIEPVKPVIQEIAALKPDFMSVTYGASGGTSANTAKMAAYIQNEYGIPALAHLSCVSSTKDEVHKHLVELKELGIENVLGLRGDIPQNLEFPLPGHYRYAAELITEIKNFGDFCIGAACYPEGHVEATHKEADLDHLRRKVECGCDFLTTQMFFDNNVLYSFLYRVMAKNINVPIIAGIMPVMTTKQILRSCQLSGTNLPPRFKNIIDKFGDDPKSLKQAGIVYATEQIVDLIANGIKYIHIYTMNSPDVAAAIMNNISSIAGRE